ncbi:MAG: AIR carboxylase family protein, partial [Gemmatimonadetes bacterium]|nr:AIR carboxylase family protein [Gemmatimonadota bacterium]
MAKKDVLIIVGSESDRDRVTGAFEVLDQAGVGYDFVVSSTHRNPEQTAQIAKDAAMVRGRWRAVPLYATPQVLTYREDVLKEIGEPVP